MRTVAVGEQIVEKSLPKQAAALSRPNGVKAQGPVLLRQREAYAAEHALEARVGAQGS